MHNKTINLTVMCVYWVAKDPSFFHMPSMDSCKWDWSNLQTAQESLLGTKPIIGFAMHLLNRLFCCYWAFDLNYRCFIQLYKCTVHVAFAKFFFRKPCRSRSAGLIRQANQDPQWFLSTCLICTYQGLPWLRICCSQMKKVGAR